MPIVDMSVEKLHTYMGRNPRPADFDEFWEKSLAEMNAIDPAPVLTPHPFASHAVDCFDLTFTSTKGAKIYAKVARPKKFSGKLPTILHFHGLSGESSSWRTLIAYASQGMCIAAMDCRGQGGLSEDVGGIVGSTYSTPFMRGLDDKPENLLVRDLFLDTAMLARVMKGFDFVDADRLGAYGGSQGGGLTLACAALVPEIKKAAPSVPYMSDYKRVWDMDLDKSAYEGLRYYFRHFDPLHEREEEIFTKLGYIDVEFLAPRIRAEVQMETGLLDTTCPPSTQFAAYNKITSQKSVLIYPDYGHETPKGYDDIVFEFFADL